MGRSRPLHRQAGAGGQERLSALQEELHVQQGRRNQSQRAKILKRHATVTQNGRHPVRCAAKPYLIIFPTYGHAEAARTDFEQANMMVGELTVQECAETTLGHFHLRGLEPDREKGEEPR